MYDFLKFMAQLRSRDVIQIDATIIAGLLILLTIQTATEPPTFVESYEQNEKLGTETYIRNSTLSVYLDKLQNELESTPESNSDKIQMIQNEIDKTKFQIWELSAELQQRVEIAQKKNDNFLVKLYEKGQESNSLIFRSIAVTMIIPFAGSIAWEVVATFDKREKDELATKGSKIWMVIGVTILILGLYGIQSLD